MDQDRIWFILFQYGQNVVSQSFCRCAVKIFDYSMSISYGVVKKLFA